MSGGWVYIMTNRPNTFLHENYCSLPLERRQEVRHEYK